MTIVIRGRDAAVYAFLSFLSLPLAAQTTFPLEERRAYFWEAHSLVSYDPFDHSINIVDSRKKEKPKRIEIGGLNELVDYSKGIFWANNKLLSAREKDKPEKRIFSSKDGQSWTLEGWIKLTSSLDVDSIHHLGNDRFLLVAFTRIELDGKNSRFALAKRNEKKELILERLLDMGLKESWGVPKAGPRPANYFGVSERYMDLFLSPSFVMRSNAFLILVYGRPGYMWMLDLRKESPSLDFVRIYDKVKEEFPRPGNSLDTHLGTIP